MRGALLFSIALLAGGAGCGKKADDAKPASGSAVAEAKPTDPGGVPVTEEPLTPGSTASGIDLSKLGEKLQYQKDHRGVGPSTDKVFEALDKAGYKAERRKQVLGDAALANYCENIRTVGLVIVVCEYSSEKEAQAGKAIVEKNWKDLNDKVERIVRGASVITVIHGGNKTADFPKIVATINAV